MGRRVLQPAIFGIAVLSFVLPFAEVACVAQDGELGARTTLPEPAGGDGEFRTYKGYQLLRGQPVPDEVKEVGDEADVDIDRIRIGAEPFAVVAFAAGLAGVASSLLSPRRRRGRDGVACGAVGLLSLATLGLAPVIRSTGAYVVRWAPGYWICITLFLAATWVSYEEHRRRAPPAPPARE